MRACDYNIYRIDYTDRVRITDQDGDFIKWQNNVSFKYVVVAPTEKLAIAAFERYHNGEHVNLANISLVAKCDDLVYLQ